MKKIFIILIATFNNIFGINKDISIPRLRICEKCNQKKRYEIVGDVCNICGCILKSKTTIESEECPLKKW